MAVKVDDKGTIDQALTFMERLPPAVLEAADLTLEEMAQYGYQLAREYVPVKTGFLRATIFWKKIKQGLFQLGAWAYYAGFVEWGTSRQDPQPYIRPALIRVMIYLRDTFLRKFKSLM
jgi:HK97 gp10 family phage protein